MVDSPATRATPPTPPTPRPQEVRHAAVLGRPIAHSLSPALHQAAYGWLDLPWTYEAFDVGPDELPGFVESLDSSWAGLSLTMPLKESVLPLLDTVEPLAQVIRSVNTVVLSSSGRSGHNTDVPGLVAVLREHGVTELTTATVLGAGATARSALAALVSIGAESVTVFTRRPEAVGDLDHWIEAVAAAGSGWVAPLLTTRPWDAAAEQLGSDVVVSTVPAGASDSLAADVVGGQMRRGLLVDVVYYPWPPPLAAAWEQAGGRVVGGLDLLVHQAVGQVELMTGRTVPAAVLRAAGLAELRRRHADGGRSRGAAGPPKQ